jgi:hypothetical protein
MKNIKIKSYRVLNFFYGGRGMFKASIKLLCAANLFLLVILMIAGGQALSPRVVDLDKGDEQIRILGDYAGDNLGNAAASGDINGDGYEDLIIPAVYADDITGTVYVIFGAKSITSSIDLHSEPADMIIYGEDDYSWDYFGNSVGSGDINGDGYDDLIIGASRTDPGGRIEAGKTYIIFGSDNPPSTLDLKIESANMSIWGDDAFSWFGYTVSSGDINGDGYDDIVVGAPFVNPRGGYKPGKTYVIFGSVHPQTSIDLSSTSADMTIYGDASYDMCGLAVASGDINGDGYKDIIIGASHADPPGGTRAGKTYVIFGSDLPPKTIELHSVSADMTIFGDDTYDYSGQWVSCGNINGDYYDDVIIGAYRADPDGRTYAGKTYIIFGSALPQYTIDLNSESADITIYGDDVNDESGWPVGSADINGDSYDDIIIGAPWADPAGGSNAGETYVIFGSTSPPSIIDLNDNLSLADIIIYGHDADDHSGFSVASGDINGNGYDDIIIGANGADPAGRLNAGESYVIFGSGLPIVCDFTDTNISDWEKVGPGRAAVRNGQLILRRTSNRFRLFPKGALASKCDIETQLIRKRGRASRVSSSIFFSYLDKRNYWELKMLLLPVGRRTKGKWILRHKKNGIWVEKQVIKDDIYRNQLYQIKIEVRSDQIRVLVNGVEKFNIAPGEKPAWGKVALGSAGPGQSLIDDLMIY